ncbi:MAG: exodeoxyribonuclease VII small subunit [Clostridia bacterium]|nr:MAG: exodeoxyribonuclease VII small subunit [Clostridia bacterium]
MAGTLGFEKAMERLESVVKTLEAGSLSLEEALRCYEEGVGLVRFCHAQLEAAEERVKILLADEDNSLSVSIFDLKARAEGGV